MMRDARLLFATRALRMFAYGFVAVSLALYLAALGLSEASIGLLFSLTIAGDALVSLWITSQADRAGRKRMLLLGAALMAAAGLAFAGVRAYPLLLIAGVLGVLSPTGAEAGPFLPIEQAALSQLLPDKQRTRVFAWYHLAGTLATAVGALAGGWFVDGLQAAGIGELPSMRATLLVYAAIGVLLCLLFALASRRIEAPAHIQAARTGWLGLSHSRGIVARLSALFAVDSFGSGLVLQTLIVYWLNQRFGADARVLGSILFGINTLSAFSALLAARLAARIGLINTMVWTHVPANVLLCALPFAPSLPVAIVILLVRGLISQMDVPTRQSYVMAVVRPEERSAASGVTNIAKQVGNALAPSLGWVLFTALTPAPFVLAGLLKIGYDLALYRAFIKIKPAEEQSLAA